MVHGGTLKDRHWLVEDNKIYLYFEGLYNIWAMDARKRGIDPFKPSSVRGYFKEEDGFLEMSAKKRIGGFPRNCVVFDYDTCGETIKDLIEEKRDEI